MQSFYPAELWAAAELVVSSLPIPEPEFDFSIGWADTYEKLFAGEYSESTETDNLIGESFQTGRVILTGRGGSGKTTVLHRVARQAVGEGVLPVYIDLKRWSTPTYESWKLLEENLGARTNFLLEGFASPRVRFKQLDTLSPSARKLFLIDGLNEVAAITGNTILTIVDLLVRDLIQAAAIVTDRLVRRDLPYPDRWRLACVKPLSPETIERVLQSKPAVLEQINAASQTVRSLAGTPFFLDEFIKEEDLIAPTSTGMLRRYFLRHALEQSELKEAARAAFEVYSERSRTFSLHNFASCSTPQIADKLISSGVLKLQDADLVYFSHHLMHDYLAAEHLADDESIWGYASFNKVTFVASSFDILALTVELLSSERAERFVRAIYDWNIYAAAYVLAENSRVGDARVDFDMERAVLAAMAERKFNLMCFTRRRAEDALALSRSPVASQLRQAATLGDLINVVREWTGSTAWFSKWKDILTREVGGSASDSEVTEISDPNSLLGWTLANVLKRLYLTSAQQALLRELLECATEIVRWRIVHVLGGFPSKENATLLLHLIETEDAQWVHYGATRSLIEIAATSTKEERRWIFESLASASAHLRAQRASLEELTRSIFIDPLRAPDDWLENIQILIRKFYAESDTLEQREKWLRLAYEAEVKYEHEGPR